MLTLSLWALVGCTTPFGLGGTDIEDTARAGADTLGEADSSDSESPGGLAIADLAWSCGDADARELHLVGGDGLIDVDHRGIVAPSCVTGWDVTPASDSDGKVTITYEPIAPDTACDGTCAWDVSYAITGLASGSWQVTADGDVGSVDVR